MAPVHGQVDQGMAQVPRKPPKDRPGAVELLPGPYLAGHQFIRRHVFRLKDHGAVVVVFPVVREQPAFLLHLLEGLRPRIRREDIEGHGMDLVLDEEPDRIVKDVQSVFVKAEDQGQEEILLPLVGPQAVPGELAPSPGLCGHELGAYQRRQSGREEAGRREEGPL